MIIDEVYSCLRAQVGQSKTITFAKTSGTGFKLLATPNMWGVDPTNNDYWNKRPAAQDFLDAITNLIASAETLIDISTLWPLPDGYFMEAIKKGFTQLVQKNRHVPVRVLVGLPPNAQFPHIYLDTRKWIDQMSESGLKTIIVKPTATGINSWNHSKIIAVDGVRAIVGGHNLWSNTYMSFAPIHDVSVEVYGAAASLATEFLSRLWSEPGYELVGRADKVILPTVRPAMPLSSGTMNVLALGKLGWGLADDGGEPSIQASRAARIFAVSLAKNVIRMSQQDLKGPFNLGWDEELLAAIAQAIIKNKVKVYIVVSNYGAKNASSVSYSNVSVEETIRKLGSVLGQELAKIPNPPSVFELMGRLFVAPLRFTNQNDSKWSGIWHGEHKTVTPGNHAKVYAIDDRAVYIGSDNAYPCKLQEFGYLIEDPVFVKAFLNDYWNKLWEYSWHA